jgi:hypothetical protein
MLVQGKEKNVKEIQSSKVKKKILFGYNRIRPLGGSISQLQVGGH